MTLVITDGEFWWGWQSLNKSIKLMFLLEFHQFNFHRYT